MSSMGLVDRLRQHVSEHQSGMVSDLLFALVWVTIVEAFFTVVEGPQWAYYMFMLAGILAYFGFFWSLELAKQLE